MPMSETQGRDSLRQPRALVRMAAVLACSLLAVPAARAELQIEITSGVQDPVPIAIVPFSHSEGAATELDVADIVQHDLEGSGRFRALSRERMPATPHRAGEVMSPAWKAVGSDYVVVGRTTALDNGSLAVDFELVNTLTGAKLAGQRFTGAAGALLTHAQVVDEALTAIDLQHPA